MVRRVHHPLCSMVRGSGLQYPGLSIKAGRKCEVWKKKWGGSTEVEEIRAPAVSSDKCQLLGLSQNSREQALK